MNAKAHIALGQTFLLTSLLLGALAFGLIPDRQQAIRDGRAQLADALAITGSAMVTQSQIRSLETTLAFVVERNSDLLSAGVRLANGRTLVSVGEHDEFWTPIDGGYSTTSQLSVPIWSHGQPWGQVELRFRALTSAGWWSWLEDPRIRLIALLSLATFALFYLYLGKMLKHLDPAQAVPPHVRSALDTLAEGLLVMDMKEQIVLANKAIAGIVGHDADALMGRRVHELSWVNADGTPFPPEEFPWRSAMATGEPRMNDIVLLRDSHDDIRTFIVNCSPVLSTSGSPGGVLISLDDVTQLEEHKAELSIAKEAADSANKAKSEFLANMSHEIRTPMNAILGFTEVLRRGYVTDEQDRQRYLETIRSSGEHLLELINNVLDLSKVESGHIETEQIRFAAHKIVHDVITTLRVKADEKGISIDFDVDGSIPETILSDPTRLRQIATNLLTNAIKFTDEGGVKVVVAAAPGDAHFVLRVTDSGVGIPESAHESIFDEFVQADSTVTRRFGGTGLGLPISRRFARILGGDISVCSVAGEGSTFTATIDAGPLDGIPMLEPHEALAATAEDEKTERAGSWHFPSARILVVDDAEENRELLRVVLEEVGLQVESAENGRVSVDKASASHFDLILMDMQMPVMDGYAATTQLREAGFSKPIIALTADAMKGFEKRCLAAGCSGYLTKPVDIDLLIETLAEPLGGEYRATDASSPTPKVVSKLVSKLADSNPQIAAIVTKFVGRLAEKVDDMQTALEAHDFDELAAQAHWLKGSAGTVGFDAFQQPAAALEQAARNRDGAEGDVQVCEIRRLADRITAAPAAAESSGGESGRARDASTNSRFEGAAVTSTLASTPRFQPIVEKFVERFGEKLEEMDDCLARRDGEALAGLAHWLKGSGGTVGFDAFGGPARDLEVLARESKWSEIDGALQEIRALFDRIELGDADR